MERTKAANFCDRAALFCLYIIAFQLPISKCIIETFSVLAIIFFLAKKFLQKEDIAKANINLAVLIYLFICLISVFISSNPQISIRTFSGKTLQEVSLFLIMLDTLNSERRIRNMLLVILSSSLLIGLDGVYQYFSHKDFIRHRPYYGLPRIHATFPTPNDFGAYLVSVIPFTLVYAVNKNKLRVLRLLSLGLFFLLFICLALTVSRGSWLAFFSVALFMSIWVSPLGVFFLILGIVIMATQQFYFPFLKGRLSNFFNFVDHSSWDRKMMWQAGWKMFMSKPLVGIGLATFMFNFDKFVKSGYPYGVPYAHNCYLQMAAEIGIIGLGSFLLIIALLFYSGVRALNTPKRTLSWYVVLACLSSILGYCVQMTVDTSLYSLDLGILFWIILGLAVAAIKATA